MSHTEVRRAKKIEKERGRGCMRQTEGVGGRRGKRNAVEDERKTP